MKLPRLFWWIILTVLLLAVLALIAPQQLPVSLYKLSLVTTAGVIGYWFDRSLFPYARPDQIIGGADDGGDDACSLDVLDDFARSMVFALAMLRRAFIVGMAMLAMGLGL